MNIEEIKQLIELHNPGAYIATIDNGFLNYYLETSKGTVYFKVPLDEIGDEEYHYCEPAKKLLKWIV